MTINVTPSFLLEFIILLSTLLIAQVILAMHWKSRGDKQETNIKKLKSTILCLKSNQNQKGRNRDN